MMKKPIEVRYMTSNPSLLHGAKCLKCRKYLNCCEVQFDDGSTENICVPCADEMLSKIQECNDNIGSDRGHSFPK